MMIFHQLLTVIAVITAATGVVLAQQGGGSRGIFAGSTDVGKTRAGSTEFQSQGHLYRVTGGGADMWGSADAFHFAWVQLSGDATLTADVHFPEGKLAPLEKAVLIFRESLEPGAAYADNAIHADGHITLQYRAEAGGKTEDITAAEHGSTRLRIQRVGDKFTASTGSADGKYTAFATTTVAMNGPVYVGIGVCAHDADGLVTVSFSGVGIESPIKP